MTSEFEESVLTRVLSSVIHALTGNYREISIKVYKKQKELKNGTDDKRKSSFKDFKS